MVMDNPLFALIKMLRADVVVRHVVGEAEVYGQATTAIVGEIDGEWASLMPRRLILVSEAGGLAQASVGALARPSFDVACYGKDSWDASELSRMIFRRLFGRHNAVAGLIAITQLAGPTPGRDEDTQWAYNRRTYEVLSGG